MLLETERENNRKGLAEGLAEGDPKKKWPFPPKEPLPALPRRAEPLPRRAEPLPRQAERLPFGPNGSLGGRLRRGDNR